MLNNNFSKILGSRLLKISDVHKVTGISKSTLTSFYYKRSSNIQLVTLIKICDYLQINLCELIEYEPKKEVN